MNTMNMSAVDMVNAGSAIPLSPVKTAPVRLHRIKRVREEQGLTLRSVAARMGSTVQTLAKEEEANTDMLLSRLHWWKRALNVPLADLLVEPDCGFSPLVLERVRMLRIMKTVAAIRERAKDTSLARLAEMLEQQLLEIVPEMKDVSPWNLVGQRRTNDELGIAAERMMSLDEFED
jgi:transcriptional regulator with XRE-family HTH domain